MTVLLLILTAIIAYCLGSLNGAIITARFIFHRDVRDYGSGNAGLTNYYRCFGVPGLTLVILIDILKSAAAVLLGGALLKLVGAAETGRLFAGFCLMMGHIFPVLYQFRGGKGVLCGATMAFLVDWRVGLICIGAFLILVILTRYVSLGSMVGAACCPLGMWIFAHETLSCVLALFCALLILVKHAENILRLIGGREGKLTLSGGMRRPRPDEEDFH
jgi:glycerol-3-phosphate acyltransferase PlsY